MNRFTGRPVLTPKQVKELQDQLAKKRQEDEVRPRVKCVKCGHRVPCKCRK